MEMLKSKVQLPQGYQLCQTFGYGSVNGHLQTVDNLKIRRQVCNVGRKRSREKCVGNAKVDEIPPSRE